MVNQLILIVISIFICVRAEDQLVFVHVLYRHGDRTPVQSYPTDPYRNESLWPVPFGQLTNKGKQRQYNLGLWLRKRYDGFLPKRYSLNDIYVESTDLDRTLMSAEAALAGLYSPIGADVWNKDVNWQPIPVHVASGNSPLNIPVMILNGSCPKYSEGYTKVLQSGEVLRHEQQLQQLYEYIRVHSGLENVDFTVLLTFYDTLKVENEFGLTLPEWTKQIFPMYLTSWANFIYSSFSYTPELQRLATGTLFNDVLTRFVAKAKGQLNPNRKMWMYSANDIHIADILNALGSFSPPFAPPYSSTILFELRKTVKNNYYIQALYKNDTSVYLFPIRNCELKCPLEKAIRLLQPLLLTPEQWNLECANFYF